MGSKFLDLVGLKYLWNKINELKQDKLVSGSNIKTINGETLLDSGNIKFPTPYVLTKDSFDELNLVYSDSDYNVSVFKSGVRDNIVNCIENGTPINISLDIQNNGNTEKVNLSLNSSKSTDKFGEKLDLIGICDISGGSLLILISEFGGNLVVYAKISTEGSRFNAGGSYLLTNDFKKNERIVDSLTGGSGVLSANQGKILNDTKQDKLVSGTNIKTINSESLLGEGDLSIPAPLILTEDSFNTLNINYSMSEGNQSELKPEFQSKLEEYLDKGYPILVSLTVNLYNNEYKIVTDLNICKFRNQEFLIASMVGFTLTATGNTTFVIINVINSSLGITVLSNKSNLIYGSDKVILTGDITKQLNLIDSLRGNDNGVLSANQGKVLNEKKQDKLVSGTNIKTINGQSLVGAGNVSIATGISDAPYNGTKYVRQNGGWVQETVVDTSNFATKSDLSTKQDKLVSGSNIKTINGNSLLGYGNVSTLQLGSTSDTAFAGDKGQDLETWRDNIKNYVLPGYLNFRSDSTTVDLGYDNYYMDGSVGSSSYITINSATQFNAGVMSASDKAKLDSLENVDTSNFATKDELNGKQENLVSGSNIKTINGETILGYGNLTIESGISDAPSNGTKYVRQNGSWVQETEVDTSDFVTTSSLSSTLSSYVTKTYANNTYALKTDLENIKIVPRTI